MTISSLPTFITILLTIVSQAQTDATYSQVEDGYRTWLRYDKITDTGLLNGYRDNLKKVVLDDTSETMQAVKKEIEDGLNGLLDAEISISKEVSKDSKKDVLEDGSLIIATPSHGMDFFALGLQTALDALGKEGYLIEEKSIKGEKSIIIAANTDLGLFYGTFHFLRMLQTHLSIDGISVREKPKVQLRTANHWDNIDRSIERGYAGQSLWEWMTLPNLKQQRYTDYARISASLGLNAVAINNVNADVRFISDDYINKIASLAEVFRPYGIHIYISLNYSSPVNLGGLDTADPLNPDVIAWWEKKIGAIYEKIPDLGGFMVKADSEGQPGPKTYGRDHAQGANMLSKIVQPFGGIIVWRAFVYDAKQKDRVREAYDEFVPLDGKFNDNVILQIKNGPLDFMPWEPFSPLFGALPKTNTMVEFQIAQEYLGQGNHLVYKGPMFKETLDAETYAKKDGSTVAEVIAGKVFDYPITGMAGVVNLGTDRNWTRHPFAQSNWYSFGRLAWDYSLTAYELADEWIRRTFSNNDKTVDKIKGIMMRSTEASIDFREPLGLAHIGSGTHYGPAPWSGRSRSFHQTDKDGIGFDRTQTGSKAVEQYHPPLDDEFNDIAKTPEKYLLWFHHAPWDYEMESGQSLWDELVHHYYKGVESVRWMQKEWDALEGSVDTGRFRQVKALLEIQLRDVIRWRDSCVLYFQTFSGKPIPEGLERPQHNLQYYIDLEKTMYVPG